MKDGVGQQQRIAELQRLYQTTTPSERLQRAIKASLFTARLRAAGARSMRSR